MTGPQTSRLPWHLVAGIALVVATAGLGEAQEPGGYRGHGGGGPLLGIPLRALSLTPDQQTQARSILTGSFTETRALALQLRQAQNALADALIAAPSADVSAQLTTINGLQSQLLQARAQATAQVLALLTPDQLAKAAQLRTELGQLRGQMRQLLTPTQP